MALCQQDRGNIGGQVTDPTGAVLPDVTVILKNDAGGVEVKTVTNASGQYHFDLLNPGQYTVRVDKAGFKTASRAHIQVDVASHVNIDVVLQLGDKSEVVEVQGSIEQLETTTGSSGLIVEERNLQELPLVYSNPYMLEYLSPGLLPDNENTNVRTFDSAASNVRVNGSASNSVEYTLDGAPNNRIRLSAFTPSTEMISQYKVQTSEYDASNGHSSGGFVNVSLKSGTNAFHGSIFGSYQNPVLNGNPINVLASTTPAAKATWNREGFAVGGPIKKDKLYFFTSYEHARAGGPQFFVQTVPTMAQRNGDFSSLLAVAPAIDPKTKTPYDTCTTSAYLSHPNPYQLFDPRSSRLSNPADPKSTVIRNCYPNNIIPQDQISPIAKKIFSYYPAPNVAGNDDGTNNFVWSGEAPDYYYALANRFDYNIGSNQKLFGHFVMSRRSSSKNQYFAPVSGTLLTYRNRGVALGYTKIMSAATVMDVRLSWTRFFNENVVMSQGKVNVTDLGMPSYLLEDLPETRDKVNAYRMPRFDLNGYTSLQADNAVRTGQDVTAGSISISHLKGNHMLRFGGEYRMINSNTLSSTNPAGNYNSTGLYTTATGDSKTSNMGFAAAEMLVGLIDKGSVQINGDSAVRNNYIAGYLHDDWRVTRNLTLNLGLRYEFEGANSERNGKANSYFDFLATSPINAAVQAAYAATLPAAVKSYGDKTAALLPLPTSLPTLQGGWRFATPGQTLYNPAKLNLMPRIGFAWALTPKTVLRGGFGMFYDSISTYYQSGGNTGSTTNLYLPQYGFTQSTSFQGSQDKGLTYPSTLADPFPHGANAILMPPGSKNGLSTMLGQSVSYLDPDAPDTYNMRWSLGLQRQFGGWITNLAYVGNRGVHIPVSREMNALPRQYMSTVTNGFDLYTYNILSSMTVANPLKGLEPGGSQNGSTISVANLLKPYPQFNSVKCYTCGNGFSFYNSLQAHVTRRIKNGLSMTAQLTWSKSMDATDYLNDVDDRPWYGIGSGDRPLRFSMSSIYELPFGKNRAFLSDGKGLLARIVGNWQVQGIYQIQSGKPISFDKANYVYTKGDPNDAAWGRSGYKKDFQYTATSVKSAGHWFDTSGFLTSSTTPTCQWTKMEGTKQVPITPCADPDTGAHGVYDSVIPNTGIQFRTFPLRFPGIRSDHMNELSIGVQRNFNLLENVKLQMRAEATNALNHAVYSGPASVDPTNKSFGQVTGQANQPRVIQFAGFIRF